MPLLSTSAQWNSPTEPQTQHFHCTVPLPHLHRPRPSQNSLSSCPHNRPFNPPISFPVTLNPGRKLSTYFIHLLLPQTRNRTQTAPFPLISFEASRMGEQRVEMGRVRGIFRAHRRYWLMGAVSALLWPKRGDCVLGRAPPCGHEGM